MTLRIMTLAEALRLPDGTVIRQAETPQRWEWDRDLFAVYVKNAEHGWDNNVWEQAGCDGWVELSADQFPFEVIAWPVGVAPPTPL